MLKTVQLQMNFRRGLRLLVIEKNVFGCPLKILQRYSTRQAIIRKERKKANITRLNCKSQRLLLKEIARPPWECCLAPRIQHLLKTPPFQHVIDLTDTFK